MRRWAAPSYEVEKRVMKVSVGISVLLEPVRRAGLDLQPRELLDAYILIGLSKFQRVLALKTWGLTRAWGKDVGEPGHACGCTRTRRMTRDVTAAARIAPFCRGRPRTQAVPGDVPRDDLAQFEVDVLAVREFEQFGKTFLASDARLLDAAEGGSHEVLTRIVDPDIARLNAPDGAVRRDEVACPDRPGQPEVDIVDGLEKRILVRPLEDLSLIHI